MGMENRLVFTALTVYIRSMYQKIASRAASFKSFHALIMTLTFIVSVPFQLDINLLIALCTQRNVLFFGCIKED